MAKMTELYDFAYRDTLRTEATTRLERVAPPWKRNKDDKFVFTFKLKAGGVFEGEKWESDPPLLFDARKRPIVNPDPSVFRPASGSIAKAAFQIKPWCVNKKTSIKFKLKAVQFFSIVEFDKAAYYGLEEDVDGYSYEPSPNDQKLSDIGSSPILIAPPPPPPLPPDTDEAPWR